VYFIDLVKNPLYWGKGTDKKTAMWEAGRQQHPCQFYRSRLKQENAIKSAINIPFYG
jgi:hypothetical protein